MSAPVLLLHDNSNPTNHVPIQSRLHYHHTLKLTVNHPNGVPVLSAGVGQEAGIIKVYADTSDKWREELPQEAEDLLVLF